MLPFAERGRLYMQVSLLLEVFNTCFIELTSFHSQQYTGQHANYSGFFFTRAFSGACVLYHTIHFSWQS